VIRRAALLLVAATLAAACSRVPPDAPPRYFMHGGMLFPAATGYWLHQYAGPEELDGFLASTGFECKEAAGEEGKRLRCERGFRSAGGVLARTDTIDIGFNRTGAMVSARSGCRFTFFESPGLSGMCASYAARGAVYPTVESWAAMAEAMLRATPLHQPVSIYRLAPGAPASLPDMSAALERLGRWQFQCEVPKQQYSVGFRGKAGQVLELACTQSSLRGEANVPQVQQVVFRYDTIDLAVLQVGVRLDDAAMVLSPAFNTLRDANARATERDRAPGAPTSLTLETTAGERFEMPRSAIGTGSRQATRDGFAALTPDSQRALVQAYLDKQARDAGDKIPYLGSLEWYGPDALPYLDALVSDERPELGAAIVKYRCFETTLRSVQPFDADRLAPLMATCIDERRAALPRSIAALDQLLADDMRRLKTSDARALNAFFDFKRDVIYVYALGREGKESAVALEEVVEGKDGLDPGLASLVQAALVQRDRPLMVR